MALKLGWRCNLDDYGTRRLATYTTLCIHDVPSRHESLIRPFYKPQAHNHSCTAGFYMGGADKCGVTKNLVSRPRPYILKYLDPRNLYFSRKFICSKVAFGVFLGPQNAEN